MAARRFRDQEIDGDLALRRQQRAEPAEPGLEQRHVDRDQAVEKVACVLAGYLDHPPVGKKRCFHKRLLLKFLLKCNSPISHGKLSR